MTNCRKYSVIYTLKPLENNISQPTNKEMNTLEQLKEDLKLAKEESKIFNILIKLSNHNINRDITDCAKYQKQALSNPNIDLATTFRLMAIKTRNFISIGDQENFLTAFDDLTVFITDNKHLEEEYSEWCVLNLERLNSLGKYEEAVTFGKKALKEINNNVKSKWKVIKQMAGCCARISKISLALALYEQALNLTEKHKLGLHNADLLNDIAVLHAENDNLENAKKYFSSALDKYEELNDIEYMINTLSALASVHSSLNEFDEAIKYYNKTIEKIHEHKYYGNYVHTLTNFGYFRLKQKNYLAYFKIEKTILSVIKDKKMTSNTAYFFYTTNSKAYLEYGNYKEAMFWIKKAEEEEATKSDLKAQLNILKLKIEIAKNAKNTEEIIAFYEKYIELKEILINESKQNAIEKFEAKYQNKLKEKEKEILRLQKIEMEQKALRAQLNPHFFFNSLNSINKYIVDNDSENASKFLFKFSSLMRKTLENSEESFLTIEEEVEFLNDYLSLEQLRFNHSFKFDFIIDEEIEDDFVKIPTMMLQPYIENSIKHGINGIKDGLIKVEFQLNEDDSILCIIEDNGSGRGISQSSHKSMGTNILENRIKILKEQYQLDFHIKTIDLKSKNNIAQGTRVELLIPSLDLI